MVLPPDVVVPARPELIQHVRTTSAADVVELDGLTVTSGSQTFLDLAATVPPAELVAIGDSLHRGEHLDADRLTERVARAGRVRGVVRARQCAPLLPRWPSRARRASCGTGC